MDALIPKFIVLGIFLAAHGLAAKMGWYHKKPSVDTITHFLGGLAVSAWIKDWSIAIALIIGWEFLEMMLVSKHWRAFRESPLNKARDVLMGLFGYFIGVDML
jgi:hypothetical protein